MKAALLTIDFINDIVHKEGKMSSWEYLHEHHVLEKANIAIKIARKAKIPIIHVKVGFSSNYLECPPKSPLFGKAKQLNALQLGTWGTEFYPNLDVHGEDLVIIKHRVSPFYATGLEAVLRAQGIDTLFIMGVTTHMAVGATAREGHDRDYQMVILEDCCGAKSADLHKNALGIITFIAQLIKVEDLENKLKG